MILIIYAHPYPHHSHANKRMLEQARTLEGVEIRSLYQLYPDFNIDIAAEQTALHGKHLLWAVTTGGGESHFEIGAHPGFDVLSQPLQATAIYCGLNWLPPFAMHCTFICDDETLEGQARHYKQRLLEWQEAHHG